MAKKSTPAEKKVISDLPSKMLDLIIKIDTEKGSTYSAFDDLFLVHNALPEIDYKKIDLKTKFLNKKIDLPICISPLTGGEEGLVMFNKIIGLIGKTLNIPIFSGDQIYAIRDLGIPNKDKIIESYRVLREESSDAPVIANLRASDLLFHKITPSEVQKCIDMIGADAISFYLSPLIDILLNQSNISYEGIIKKVESIKKEISVPIIMKEYTAGLSHDVVRRLWDIGVEMFDVSGYGGTNMCKLVMRKNFSASVKQTADPEITPFDNWGIPQIWSLMDIKMRKENAKVPVILSGGIRSGDQIVKGLICGADYCGIAFPMVSEIYEDIKYLSEHNLETYLEKIEYEIKITMFVLGFHNLAELKESGKNKMVIFGKTLEWMRQRNLNFN